MMSEGIASTREENIWCRWEVDEWGTFDLSEWDTFDICAPFPSKTEAIGLYRAGADTLAAIGGARAGAVASEEPIEAPQWEVVASVYRAGALTLGTGYAATAGMVATAAMAMDAVVTSAGSTATAARELAAVAQPETGAVSETTSANISGTDFRE